MAVGGAGGGGEFRQAQPGYPFAFPRDHYAHDLFRTEWWYYTGRLLAEGGQEYGYQMTFFRSGLAEAQASPSRRAVTHLYLAHFAVGDFERKTLRYFERVHRAGLGQAGASESEFRVWVGDWSASGNGIAQRLQARDEGFGLNVVLTPQRPPLIHGQRGISRKGKGRGQASHYYSLSRLATEGTLIVDGKTLGVKGLTWMDHEFGSAERDPDVGWDWFSLQFEHGGDLMFSFIRKKDGGPDPYTAGTWVSPDGTTRHLRQGDVGVQVLDRWMSPRSKAVYPTKWRLTAPALGLNITVTPVFPDQELDTAKSTQVIYWKGAVRAAGTIAGRAVTAQGYVEMTGYAGPFRKKL